MIETLRPGIWRRAIRVRADSGGVRADLADDQHRMTVSMHHDGKRVTAIEGLSVNTPWSICPSATSVLALLVGLPLEPNPIALAKQVDAKQQCTHLFDLASLAIAYAARGIARRDYEIEAPWYRLDRPRAITLYRDNKPLWTWSLDSDDRLVGDGPFAGLLAKDLLKAGENVGADLDTLEALFVTRRAVLISQSRRFDLDRFANAAAVGQSIGACYAYRPERAEHALRRVGSTADFTDRRDALLRDIANDQ